MNARKSASHRFLPLLLLTGLFFAPLLSGAEGEIGFIERFALAKNRAEIIGELIPGTEDFYYFSSLLAQQEGRIADADALLEPWLNQHGRTERVVEIQNRQALLKYSANPQLTLSYLKEQLGLTFNHQQQRLDAKPDFPTRLDPAVVSSDVFRRQALQRTDLSGVSDAGLESLLRDQVEMSPAQRRELLSRLKYPDYEQLTGLIAADLRSRESGGFGEFAIHGRLTLAQLDELAGLKPELASDPRFVETRLLRLRPGADESPTRNPEARAAQLDRLWAYVQTLPPSFGALKASILFRRLETARTRGEYPREEFIAYLQLPRAMPYMKPEYLREQQSRGFSVDTGVDFSGTTGFGPIGNDESLVRDYLEHFFIEDETYNRFSAFVHEPYLKRVFAETKLLYGVGDSAQWFAMLSPVEVQRLRDRVEILFTPSNPENFGVNEEVTLAANLKNVKELIVKVYEINALNFYLDRKEEINTDLNLDGLVANEEKVYRYEDAPVRRRTESFPFDSLKGKRGIWVVEMIGNGISSRALVRKGRLQHLSMTTVGGELVTVLDEDNAPLKNTGAWFGGRRYSADENGLILLPFSESGTVPVVLTDGDFASLVKLDLPAEDYRFTAGFLLEQETLLPGTEATLVVRPSLSLRGEAVRLSHVKEARLTVSTRDLDGIDSLSEAKAFPLFDDRESLHTFRVPSRLRSVTVELSGKIASVSRPGEKSELRVSRTFEVNGIDSQELVADSYLSRLGENYVVEVLGKSGEAIAERAVQLTFSRGDFTFPVPVTLKTDPQGRINLGTLDGISSLTCRPEGFVERNWELPADRVSGRETLHAKAGEVVDVPLSGNEEPFSRSDFAIFETRSGMLIEDLFSRAKWEEGMVKLEGLKAGDYELVLKGEGRVLALKVTDSLAEHFGYALSKDRHLQRGKGKPLQIGSVERKGEKVEISLVNADATTRVHLLATRFLPEFDPFAALDSSHGFSPFEIRRGSNASRYVSGRDIGEEYRYILERRGAKKFPGNMLSRPGLILNPWELNETSTTVAEAAAGEEYTRSREMEESMRKAAAESVPSGLSRDGRLGLSPQSPALGFLARQAVLLPNLEVGEGGILSLDIAEFGDRQHLHILAVNGADTAYRQMALNEPEGGVGIRDLRLKSTLDLEKEFTQRRNVTLLKKGETLTVDDFRASELETYDTAGSIYGALLAINPDENFAKFGFLANWADLDEAKKREHYSDHASHELNFFLSRKDAAFFEAVVLPYLKNKKDKTFLDFYLIGGDLERFLAPWEFGRLNIVERILLARRMGEEERLRTAGHVGGLHELIPPDPERDAFYFRRALRGRGADSARGSELQLADAGGGAGGAAAADKMEREGLLESLKDRDTSLAVSQRGVSARRMMAPGAAAAPMPASEPIPEMRAEELASVAATDSFGFSAPVSDEELLGKAKAQALYRVLESTRELAENNYYQLPIADQNAELVTVNGFWKDFANWNGEGGFYSREFPGATRNFTEMMFVLSVLDLPFAAEEHTFTIKDNVLKLTSGSPLVVFHEEIQEAAPAEAETPILVSQNVLRVDDRFRVVDGQQIDKFVTGEFLTGVVYATQVVVTNPTSSAHRLDLLVQIPEGAVPVAGSDYTRSYPLQLLPFSTQSQEVRFYFPSASGERDFAAYPVRVSKNEEVIAAGEAMSFDVVEQPTNFDEASWEYLSQFGTGKEVLDYLASGNLHRIDLSRIAWRTREDVDFFKQVTALIGSRHAYDDTLWSYGIHHNVTGIVREYLKHREDFLSRCGRWIECELVSLDPVERHWYQHLEYSPMVNARTHRLGREQKILNDRFRSQYRGFLELASYKPALGIEDRLGVAAYLSLQDRVDEALEWLATVDGEEVSSRLQYDYLTAYHALYRENIAEAKAITAAYADYPVDRWREKFAEVGAHLREIEGNEVDPNEETREGQMQKLSSKDPLIDLTATGREAKLVYRNLDSVTVNYYEMDLEFLFSSKPFVSGGSGQFSFIKPNLSEVKELPADREMIQFTVPDAFASKNVLVEVVGAGRTDSVAVYSNSLNVRISGNYGQMEVRNEEGGAPVSRAYVKVYARMKNGEVRFFKDGYTDLRGKFDYVSLSTNELNEVKDLSLLVMSEANGSLVREVAPPQR